MNLNKKKLAAGAGAGVLALSLIGGGTFALWSDFQVVEDNNLGAAALTLELNDGNAVTPMSFTGLAPGENQTSSVFIANRSDNTAVLENAPLSLQIQNLVGTEDGCTSNSELPQELANGDGQCNGNNGSPFSPGGQFAEQAYMQLRVKPGISATECTGGNPGTQVGNNTISNLAAPGNSFDIGTLDPGESICLTVIVGLPGGGVGGDNGNDGIDFAGNADSDNAVQGDSASFDLRFNLEQVIPNP